MSDQELPGVGEVWIVESGEYEQRGVVGVFGSEELALDYCRRFQPDEMPTAYELWNRTPVAVTHYSKQGVFGASAAHLGWSEVEGGSQKFHEWASNEVYCSEAATSRIAWWHKEGGPVYVEVSGNDPDAVADLFRSEWASVVEGRRPIASDEGAERG